MSNSTTTAAASGPVAEEANNVDGGRGAELRELRSALMVVASLIATSTYQAAVNPPSRLNEADGSRYQAFRFFNGYSFVNAVGIMMHLLLEAVISGKVLKVGVLKILIIFNLLFFAASFALVYSNSWKSTSYAMVSPVYYVITCLVIEYKPYKLVIEYLFKRKQRKESSAALPEQDAAGTH